MDLSILLFAVLSFRGKRRTKRSIGQYIPILLALLLALLPWIFAILKVSSQGIANSWVQRIVLAVYHQRYLLIFLGYTSAISFFLSGGKIKARTILFEFAISAYIAAFVLYVYKRYQTISLSVEARGGFNEEKLRLYVIGIALFGILLALHRFSQMGTKLRFQPGSIVVALVFIALALVPLWSLLLPHGLYGAVSFLFVALTQYDLFTMMMSLIAGRYFAEGIGLQM